MKDKRLEKIKKHYNIQIDNLQFKILSCKVDQDHSIFTIKTKIMGQHFPHDNNCQVLIPDDTIHSLTIGFKTMYKDEKIETWWRDYYEIEADSLEEAIEIILSGEVDPYDTESMVDLQMEPTETEILDEECNIVYDSKQL